MSSFNSLRKLGVASTAAAFAIVVAGVSAGGCGGGADLSTESNFCAAVAQQDCNMAVVEACYEPSAETADQDTQECIAFESSPEVCNPLNLPYQAAFAQGCLTAHANLYGGAPAIDGPALAALQTACAAVFNKGGQTGEPCAQLTDCDVGDGYVCLVRATGGTCQIPEPVSAGDSCAAPNSQCATGYYCNPSVQACIAAPTAGAPCSAAEPCAPSAYCKIGAEAKTGICEDLLPDQAACTADAQCQGGYCDAIAGGGAVCAGSPAPLSLDSPACTSTFASPDPG